MKKGEGGGRGGWGSIPLKVMHTAGTRRTFHHSENCCEQSVVVSFWSIKCTSLDPRAIPNPNFKNIRKAENIRAVPETKLFAASSCIAIVNVNPGNNHTTPIE